MAMNIRSSTLLRIGVTCAVLVVLQYIVATTIIRNGFDGIARETAHQNVDRARFALGDLLQRLDYFTRDWASWDDTYRFVQDHDSRYRDSNLMDASFTDQDVNLAVFMDSRGQMAWGRAFDADDNRDPALLRELLPAMRPGGPLFEPARTTEPVSGWLRTPRGMLLAAARPILPSNEEGTPRGALIMGRLVDAATLRGISRRTRLDVALFAPDDAALSRDERALVPLLDAGAGPLVQPLNKDTQAGYALLRDVWGRPAALLRVDMPRELERQAAEVVRYNAMSIVLAGMVFGVVILLLLEGRILSRVESLSGQVQAVGASGGANERVEIDGDDELGGLAQRINAMLAELGRSRADLAEQVAEGRENERFLHSLLNSVQAGIALIDPASHRIVEVNDFALRMTGQTRQAVEGMVCHGLLCPAQTGRCPVTDLGQDVDLSLREVVCAGGQRLPVIKSVTTVMRHGRELLLETFIDISDIQRAQEALRLSEQTYRTVFSAAGTAMAIAAPDGVIGLANSEFESLVGRKSSELKGAVRWQDLIHPEDRGDVWPGRQGDRCPLRERTECRVLAADGSARHVILSTASIPGSGDTVLSMLDITARKDAERRIWRAHDMLEAKVAERTRDLREANQRLLEMDHLKTTFLSSASHELRTPLTSVLGFAKLMDKTFRKHFLPLAEGDASLERKAHHFADNFAIIRAEGERLTRLINDLLDLNKIESGRMDWRDEPLDLAPLMDHVLQALSGEIAAKPDVSVQAEAEGGLPRVLADRDRIEQVLVNLVANAVKFTDQGGVRLSARPAKGGELVEVRVRDTGVGIEPNEAERIFDRFYQSQRDGAARNKPMGTGLGLAICRQIVDHYGGDIWVESVPGRGSTFIFRLPALAGLGRA